MAERMKSAVRARSRHNAVEDRMLAHVGSHKSGTKPTSINFLRKYIKKMNEQINATLSEQGGLTLDDFGRSVLEKQRNHTFKAIRLFQESYAKGDYIALAAKDYCRRNGVPLQDDPAVTVSHSNSTTSLKRLATVQNGEITLGYTPRPGRDLRRASAIENEWQREQQANVDLDIVLKGRRQQ